MKCTTGDCSLERGHDWVPVPRKDYTTLTGKYNDGKLLWACPCDAFRWTSYAEWEKRQSMLEAAKKAQEPVAVTWSGDNNSPAPRA